MQYTFLRMGWYVGWRWMTLVCVRLDFILYGSGKVGCSYIVNPDKMLGAGNIVAL